MDQPNQQEEAYEAPIVEDVEVAETPASVDPGQPFTPVQ
jgi:hypothetical protein